MKLTAALATAVAVLTLAACGPASNPGAGSGGPTKTGPRSSAAAPVPTASSSSPTAAASTSAASPVKIPSPDAAQTAQLLDQLAGIVPALAGPTDDDAVQRARNTCLTLVGVDGTLSDAAGAARYLARRAAADSIVVSDDQAARAVTVIESTFCPTS